MKTSTCLKTAHHEEKENPQSLVKAGRGLSVYFDVSSSKEMIMTTETGKIKSGELNGVEDKISAPTPEPQPAQKPNPFDPTSLRMDQAFVETACVEKLLTIVPVGRPNSQEFFRVNHDPAFHVVVACIEVKVDRETYLVDPRVTPGLAGEYVLATLYVTITRGGTVSLWPVKVPGSDGRR